MAVHNLIVVGPKTPLDVLPFAADFQVELTAAGDTLIGSTPAWSFENPMDSTDTTSLHFASLVHNNYKAIATISLGRLGVEYVITCTVTTALGNTYQRSAYLSIVKYMS